MELAASLFVIKKLCIKCQSDTGCYFKMKSNQHDVSKTDPFVGKNVISDKNNNKFTTLFNKDYLKTSTIKSNLKTVPFKFTQFKVNFSFQF